MYVRFWHITSSVCLSFSLSLSLSLSLRLYMYTCQVSFLKRMNKNNKHDRYKIIQVPYDFTNTKFIEMKHQNVVVSMLWGCPSPIYMYVLYSVLKQLFVCTFINDRYQYSSYSYIAISVLICRSRSKQTYDGNDPDLTLRAMSMQKLLSHILSKCNLLFCPFTHFFCSPHYFIWR